ncbi:efflux RND transporter permease subunit [Membranihabitans maritimus]|uniref:efflux RND transporter permease subunit n=1 Tax=Membranihabitans maritimus TaxID=2904244 RepID=UPI001F3DF2D4|nr:efflux RND transporter permease subunit [Membranihabitans maritimus]
MKISEYAVKNYQLTLVLFIMVAAVGISTLFNMPRSEDPAIHAPQFPIIVIYPGTGPADMEELVVDPLEKRIYALEDIKEIDTKIRDGVAVLTVEYLYDSDEDEKYQELIREVNNARDELPGNILSLEVQKAGPSLVNIIQAALVSENAPYSEMKKYGERLQEQLEKIQSLKEVEIHGLPDETVRIELNSQKMAYNNIPLKAVMGTLQSDMANIPGGIIEAGKRVYNIKTSGNFTNIKDISNTIIQSVSGKNIRLSDVASIHKDHKENNHITRINGYRSIFITAALKEGFNISKSQEEYLPVLETFSASLPQNLDLILAFDQAEHVNHRLMGLGKDFLIAIFLVLFTLLPLGGRASLIVMISIPLSLSIGLIILNVLGFGLNQLSIVGLVVALGLLVDDSIVVVENIERWIREGNSRIKATIMGTKQIGLSVIGTTATLLIAFMPLALLPEASGDFIRSLPIAVMSSVLASMVVALTIIPFLSSRILKQHSGAYTGNLFMRLLKRFISGSYARILRVSIRRPVITLIAAAIIFGGSLGFIPVIGFSLFPQSEKPQFVIDIYAPQQTRIGITDQITRDVEMELEKIPEVQYYSSNIGKGNPRIYYNVLQSSERTDYSQVFVQLQAGTSQEDKQRIAETLRHKFAHFSGAKIEVKHFEQGPPILAPVEVRIYGERLDTLRNIAARVEQMLNAQDGTIYVNNPVDHLKTDIKVAVNQEKAHSLGVNLIDIDQTVRMAIAGTNVGSFTDENGDKKDIIITTPKEERATLTSFNNLQINNTAGAALPLGQVAQLEFESSPLNIYHKNKARTVSVTSFVRDGFLNDRVITEVIDKMENMDLPKGYAYEMGGEFESRQESFGGFGTVILVTAFLFIAILILLFKTFKSTLIVLSVIPLGMVGALIALWITGNSLSFVAVVGLIALAGIEVKNSILLVDFTNQLRSEGVSLDEAIREAGELRFLPIILTTLTAIGGLIPIAMSSNPLISPLAIVIIGGLISSTLLSRIVTPVVYKLIPPGIELE